MPTTESNAVARPQGSPKIAAETMEKVLIQGDLKALTPRERVNYYDAVCKSLGLNPLTRPFQYLLLNNKLQLYSTRECTDQLRQLRNVSIEIKAREITEGTYVVTASASLPNGRHDESIGAVSIDGLKGEARSNAMMKAETKSKRRVTLSICGLAFLDESELDSLRGATPVDIDPATGEVLQSGSVRPWTTFKGMLECLYELKARLGPENESFYYAVLKEFDKKHANEFKDPEQALACYHRLLAIVEEREGANFPQAQSDSTTAARPADPPTSNP